MENGRIKVLFIVSSLTFGGAEKHVITLLNALDIARFRLSLAYLKDDGTLLPQLDIKRLEGGGFCCHVSKKIDMRAVRKLVSKIRDDAVDIVVCVNNYPLLYGWLARIFSGQRPRLVEIFHTTEIGNSFRDRLDMLFYRPMFMASHMLVYVCHAQQKYWRARALRARNEVVIHNGIDIDYFTDRYTAETKHFVRHSFGFSAEDYIVGLCAAMRPEKAHGDLLRAVANLRASGVDIKCIFIGDGAERLRITRQIEAMGLVQHVKITGFMEDVRPVIAACDVMTIVSHRIETFSIAALEAMALGKPMIMSKIGGAAEQVIHGENGYLYDRGDIATLADALRKLHDPLKRRQMGACAQSVTAQRFAVRVMVDAYAHLFIELAQSPIGRIEDVNAA